MDHVDLEIMFINLFLDQIFKTKEDVFDYSEMLKNMINKISKEYGEAYFEEI